MGFDAVLLNTAVATAADPVRMARAFADAIEAGRAAYEAGLMQMRDMAAPSTPVAGTPFFDLRQTKVTRHAGGGLDVFYPIVPDLGWLQRLVPLGVRTIQLRLKDAPADVVRREIAAALDVCTRHGCQLIVNDYWREAHRAAAPTTCIWARRISPPPTWPRSRPRACGSASARTATRSWPSRSRREPDYVALGPIYETKLKVMKWAPQGLDRIADWKAPHRRPAALAIGGITPERRRRRAGGRRRQRRRHHGFLHARRPGGAGAPMARVGGRHQRSLSSFEFLRR